MKIYYVLISLIFSFSAWAETDITFISNKLVNDKPVIERHGIERSWQIKASQRQALLSAKLGEQIAFNDFPAVIVSDIESEKYSPQSINLTRYEIMAPNAKILIHNGQNIREIQPSNLLTFSDAKSGLGLVIDPKTGDTEGVLSSNQIRMYITGNLQTGLDFRFDELNKSEKKPIAQCESTRGKQPKVLNSNINIKELSKTLVLPKSGSIEYETVIAVDTDNEWMAGKNNNTTTAMNYIVTLFSSMNVFFERDLSLRLLIGQVNLRIGDNTDPYPTDSNASNSLTDFGEYWRVNQNNVHRDFALLLSGQNISSNSFSGIAWVDVYCSNGFQFNQGNTTAGSYSVNRIGTNFSAAGVAIFVGHEIGHNLGSDHTHCYNPVVDQCYNGEADFDCYAGTPACPASGNNRGTIMSYCHFGAPDGAGCGSSNENFHPTVISNLNSRIVNNFPNCIQPLGFDNIFDNSFE